MNNVDEVAERLYRSSLGDFVAERKAAASAARKDGDRDAATAIGALPKPSTAAWVVNQLVRSKPELMDSLEELGGSLREAQDDLDPQALRALGDQRRKLVAAVATQAVDVAEQAGQKVGPSIREEVEQTLHAALADERAGDAVRTGRLVRALQPNGFDAVELDGAIGGDGVASPARAARKKSQPGVDEVAEARRRKEEAERERVLAEADAAADAARAAASDAEKRRQAAESVRDERRAERDDLRRRLEEVEDALSQATSDVRAARAAADDARDARDAAEEAIDRVRRRLPGR